MPSLFLGIYRALYSYSPQSEGELTIEEGDLLYVLEKSTTDDWWKAKKRSPSGEADEPEGLIPSNYIEEATPIAKYKALYDYERQTDEEMSFSEETILDVYDISDPEWVLVGYGDEYGFAPGNYLEEHDGDGDDRAATPTSPDEPPAMPPRPLSTVSEDYAPAPPQSAAAAVASILQSRSKQSSGYTAPSHERKKVAFTPDPSDEEEEEEEEEERPQLPSRPRGDSHASSGYSNPMSPQSPPTDFDQIDVVGMHTYPINEVISKKKHPATLALGNGVITLTPHRKNVSATTWSIEDLEEYSADGKRVGLDLKNPIQSLDIHAGSKETASEIIYDLGEMRGALRAVGLREIMVAATSGGKQLGSILYHFDAQGDDEVSCKAGDEVIILDDSTSDEWWKIRRTANNKEGVVPSQYVEVKKTAATPTPESPTLTRETSSGKAKNASGSSYGHGHSDSVGPGIKLPKRGASLASKTQNQRKSRSEPSKAGTKPKPDMSKVRTWTDRSSTFKVDAEFLSCKDGVIHLHKTNGVKIAVPVIKMSRGDLEFVERETGVSLDDDKPLSDIRGKAQSNGQSGASPAGITIDRAANQRARQATGGNANDYDWFDFFLSAGVDPNACQRYASNFARDNMDEVILPDITPSVLRTLGLKEGDIIRVMKHLDKKYGRENKGKEAVGEDGEGSSQGGLFSGPGGTLKNNTRKGRPAPGVVTSDVVDSKVFEQDIASPVAKEPAMKQNEGQSSGSRGFDDDAWAPKPSKQAEKSASPAPQAVVAKPAEVHVQPQPQPAALSGALAELSLLSPPLQPNVVPQPPRQEIPQQQQQQQQQQFQATPQNILSAPLSGAPQQYYQQPLQAQNTAVPGQYSQFQPQQLQPQQTAQQQQFNQPRQRPAPPQTSQPTGLLPPPPIIRPTSAPGQNFGHIAPLQPTATGYQNPQQTGYGQPGQLSLADLQRFQQQQQQQSGFLQNPQPLQGQPSFLNAPYNSGFQPQVTGFQPQITGFQPQQPSFQQNGFQQQQQNFQQPVISQPTGFLQSLPPPFVPTVNLSLPPALIPQKTSNGPNQANLGFGQGGGLAPLKPQATGPAPAVKFGSVGRLTAQRTGRPNLSAATPENPFGF